jgi:hypothetical protein
MAIRQIVGGNFQDPEGNPLNGGSVTFRLTTDAVATGTQVTAAILTKATLDTSGNIVGTVKLWPNDQLNPSDTIYRIKAYVASGLRVWETEAAIPSGGGSFDLGTLVPIIY